MVQLHLNAYAVRMQGAGIHVLNGAAGTESLCGVLEIGREKTVTGQTYRIPCEEGCGDEIVVRVRHDKSAGFSYPGCIHMREIEAYISSEPIG